MKAEVYEQKEQSKAGKIKWRQHELIIVTVMAVAKLSIYLWSIYHLSDQTINRSYAGPFNDMNVPFNLYRNEILPEVGMGLLIYLSYLRLSLYTVPRFLFPKKFEAGTSKISLSLFKISFQGLTKKIIKEYAWLFIQVLFVVLLLGVASDTATYFKHEWQFHYPEFSIFFDKNNPNSQLNLSAGFSVATRMLILYALYVCIREVIINLIAKSKQREYNILICNKVTSFILLFFCVAAFLATFNIVHDNQFFISFSLYIPALFAMYISNVYWLFPMKGDDPFFSKKIIIRLLFTSFIYSIPLVVFIHEQGPIAFLIQGKTV